MAADEMLAIKNEEEAGDCDGERGQNRSEESPPYYALKGGIDAARGNESDICGGVDADNEKGTSKAV